jgi:hypothetical protein
MKKNKAKKIAKDLTKQQDVFATTKHAERQAIREMWKDVDLDAKPDSNKAIRDEMKLYAAMSSPFTLGNDYAKPSGYRNDQSIPKIRFSEE